MEKSIIRKKMRDQRKKLSVQIVSTASQAIFEKIRQHPLFLEAQHIAFYMPDENEIDPMPIMRHASTLKKTIYFPVINSKKELQFYLVDDQTRWRKNQFGIDEPMIENQEPILIENLNLIFVPLVAFDSAGNRIGRGGGYYDRALRIIKNKKPHLIGLAYAFQQVDQIEPDEWDVRLNEVVCEL